MRVKTLVIYHIKEKMSKAMNGIGIIEKLSKTLPCHSLITIYKSFVTHTLIMVILIMTTLIMRVSIN